MATTSASSTPISPPIKGNYFTGDGCRRDEDGYYWITGRVDDVINVSGHRMGTAEVEIALVAHPKVVGSGGRRLSARHQGPGHLRLCDADGRREPDEALRKELSTWVRKEIGPIASPDLIQFAPGLPKTRSGKIMRRILRKIAEDDLSRSATPRRSADPPALARNRSHRSQQAEHAARGKRRDPASPVKSMRRPSRRATPAARREPTVHRLECHPFRNLMAFVRAHQSFAALAML